MSVDKAPMQTEPRTVPSAARPWLRVLEALAWGAFFACALAFLGARYWLLPNIERYREDIVDAVSRSVGLKVSAGRIEAAWHGLRPQLLFTDVRLFDRDGREALVLPAVEGVVAWRTLLHNELTLHSLAINRPRLTLRRDPQGAIYVAGMKLAQAEDDGGFTDWVLAQSEIEIRNAEIDWLDEQRGAPPLQLTALNFRLRNDGDRHAFGLSARPPRLLGSGFDLRAELIGRSVTEPGAWNGRVFAELGYTDLAGWRAWFDYPVDVRKGQGALRLWTTLGQGRVTRATADLALTDVAAHLAADLPLLEVTAVRGRLYGRLTARGYEFGVRQLALAAARGPAMQSTSFRATWQRGEGQRAPHGSLAADQIELAPLARLAEFVPFPAGLRQTLLELAPQGNLFDVRFDWTGDLPDATKFNARARFGGLAMNAWRTIPGFAGLSGNLEASEANGRLQLDSTQAELDLPRVFPEPRIALATLNGEVQWERRDAAALLVRIPSLSFANADLAGTAFGSYRYTGTGPGVIDLSAQLKRADGRRTAKYLPLSSILGAVTREWLAGAILAGQASDVRFRLKGDLREFPFVDAAKGQFQVAARVKGAVLDYASGWPRIEDIDGELLFERDRMAIVGRTGRILGAAISNVRVGIPNLLAEHPLLTINGQAEGPSAEFLAYIQRSPVRRMIDGFTDGIRADGRGRLQLKLDLPLDDLAKSRIAGEYRFAANSITVDARLPPVERASGQVHFTEAALSLNEVRGQLFGGPAAISGGTAPQGGIAIVARGEATVQGMSALFEHPWRTRLSGGAPYTATVAVGGGRTQITFESSLRGVASDLPPPLAKGAAEPLPLRVEVFPESDRDRITLALGSVAAADFHRLRQGDSMRLLRAGLVLNPSPGEAPRVPERRGVMIHGALPALDLDRWRPLLRAGGSSGAGSFDLRFGTLDVLGKRLNKVTAHGNTDDAGWTASVNATELAGDLVYRAAGRGTLNARLKHFTVPDAYPGAGTLAPGASALPESAEISELPAVDLVAESFAYRRIRFGRIEVAAQNDGPNWRIDRIAIVNPEGALSGKGLWRTGSASSTALELKVESSDVGRLLERLGHGGRVSGGKGKLEGSLEWSGDPLMPNLPSLAGQLSLHAESAQFPRIETGLGRILSLVSLNLSEATAKGYAFDAITGAFTVTRGVAHTEDLKIRSSAAEVTMKGDIDLARESQNLQVRVVPSVRRGVTTIATIVNPAIALGVAVGQAVLKDPFGQIFSAEYAVSGSWGDPKVERTDVPPPDTTDPAFRN
ncbi:MAG: TIGR02099 family protein [Betaproteobacteria bacterium]|nr:MAG: TIGR02099 family protein [Betaproteobacteria bacterium]